MRGVRYHDGFFCFHCRRQGTAHDLQRGFRCRCHGIVPGKKRAAVRDRGNDRCVHQHFVVQHDPDILSLVRRGRFREPFPSFVGHHDADAVLSGLVAVLRRFDLVPAQDDLSVRIQEEDLALRAEQPGQVRILHIRDLCPDPAGFGQFQLRLVDSFALQPFPHHVHDAPGQFFPVARGVLREGKFDDHPVRKIRRSGFFRAGDSRHCQKYRCQCQGQHSFHHIVFSILLFGERLNLVQWLGVAVVMAALFLSSRSRGHDTDKVTSAKGVAYMVVSVLSGAASALWDKVILKNLEPLFVQSWANLYITVLLALVLLVHYWVEKEQFQRFTWDWSILLIAVLITVADALYFFAMKDPNGMVSIISMIRRTSVVVTFVGGALLFKEGHIRDKAVVMVLMLTGVALLLGGSA